MSCLGYTGELNESKYLEWEIVNFFSLPTTKGPYYSSPSFTLGNSSWHLRIFPGGGISAKTGFLSVFLANESSNEYLMTYSLHIKKSDGSLIGTKTDTAWISDIFGYWHFYERCVLKQRESELVPSGILTIVCALKLHGQENREQVTPEAENLCEKQTLESHGKLADLDVLSENFRDLLSKEDSCDVVLQVKDKEFKAHKTILMARSLVFAAMFQHDTSEKQTGFIDIPDCDSESFWEFLEYIYCGKIEDISYCSAYHLYSTSHKYDVQRLKEFCVDFLIKSLTPDNVCEVVILADKYNETELMSAAQHFFTENFSKIFLTPEWENLLKNNYHLANKLLIEMSKIKGSH